jgi:DNA polymerase-1
MKMYPTEPVFQGIMDFRKSGKMLDFLKSKVGEDGRMKTSFNASGTETGRISSSKTIWGTGMNLMNVPKHLRDIFVAPEGRSFIKEDLSQAETMVVADILKRHGDSTLWDRYQDPEFDIHRWMASCIYKKPEHKISKTERNVGKIANHSGNYRAGPKVLETAAVKYGIPGISYQVAREILKERSRALPGLEKWWQWIEDELRRTRTLWTCLGRRRIFFGRLDHKTFRNATAFEPQSTVGDATNIIFTGLDRELDDDCYPVLQVHDEVVIECPDRKIGECLDILRELGKVELHINEDKPLIIPMDIGIGKDWKNCKDI